MAGGHIGGGGSMPGRGVCVITRGMFAGGGHALQGECAC